MHFQALYTQTFNKQSGDADNAAMLKEVTNTYPYFSLAHFFLLQYTVADEQDYNDIAAKTALHFSNPHLLNEHLYGVEPKENGVAVTESTLKETIETSEVPAVIPSEETAAFDALQNIPSIQTSEETIQVLPIREDALKTDAAEEAAYAAPIQEKKESTQIENLKEAPLFEPLFASDYFASQGIKLSEKQQPTDRMGKQLKSFTEWLKTMKKVHDYKQPTAGLAIDLSVQNLAEKSNKEAEVLTESMADVYVQQGKMHKAREIYEKLSLLNPSKNAYFAAKIEQIK